MERFKQSGGGKKAAQTSAKCFYVDRLTQRVGGIVFCFEYSEQNNLSNLENVTDAAYISAEKINQKCDE